MTYPNPTVNELGRVDCPWCGRSTRPRKDGVMRRHDRLGHDGDPCRAGGVPLDQMSLKRKARP